jgi:anti-sigma regulatory factor (Ser/Thr protein kinase)
LLDSIDSLILATATQSSSLASSATEASGMSRVAISRRIKRLADKGYLSRHGSGTRQTYSLGAHRFWSMHCERKLVIGQGGEFAVWESHLALLLQNLQPNVYNLANIAFTEMLNNAIDHSDSKHLAMGLHFDGAKGVLEMFVADDGVGIFERISKSLKLFDKRLAILELAKGKFTTAPAQHSGMGVFVSSRMMDSFCIESGGLTFAPRFKLGRMPAFEWVNANELFEKQKHHSTHGTLVRMALVAGTQRTAQEVYEKYFSSEEVGQDAFHTTEVPVKLAQLSSQLNSRSQGKWVLARATQFKTVILDFEGVDMVGQGFADEVFRVFTLAHPEVALRVINVSEPVKTSLRMLAPHFRA